jgi:YD repeat-containing protein
MVAIVSGNSLGLQMGSLAALGNNGAIGAAGTGSNGEQAYVNVTTGDLVLQDVDGFLAGPGDSSFEDLRTYNGQGGSNGAGSWLYGSYKSIATDGQTPPATLTRTDSDGSTNTYMLDAATVGTGTLVYTAQYGFGSAPNTISVTGSTYIWTNVTTGDTETYGAGPGTNGQILIQSAEDPSGNQTNYAYSDGLLQSVSNTDGDVFNYSYNASNLLASVSVTLNTLDASDPSAGLGNPTSTTSVFYTYYSSGPAAGKLQNVAVSTDGGTTTYNTSYCYDPSGNQVTQIAQGGMPNGDGTQDGGTSIAFTYSGAQVTSITSGDQTTTFTYGQGSTRVTDTTGISTLYFYNSLGNSGTGQITSIIGGVPAGDLTGSTGTLQASYQYNSLGDVTQITDGLGNVTTMTYEDGDLVRRTDPSGDTTIWTYTDHQVTSQTVYTIPGTAPQGDTDGTGDSVTTAAGSLPNPSLSGTSTGGDTFQYNIGFGAVTISESSGSNGQVNVLSFGTGITAASVTAYDSGSDLVLALSATDRVTITNGVAGVGQGWGVQQVHFTDGTVWTAAQLKTIVETAGPRNTALSGTSSGNDTFTYNAGDGAVSIYEQSGGSGQTNTLVFGAGIAASSILVSASGNNLVLSLSLTDTVTITNGNLYSGNGWGIQQIRFADGTTWNAAQLKALAETAGPGNAYITGSNAGNDSFTYNAGDGAATIYESSGGSGRTNTLTFGAGIAASAVTVSTSGNDLVLSLSPTDKVTITNGNAYSSSGWGIQQVRFADGTIWNAAQLKAKAETAGPGNASITGTNAGNDGFTYNAGDGAATIYESSGGSGQTNTLTFGAGISAAAAAVTVSASGNDLVLTLSSTDKVTITNGNVYSSSGWGIQQVRFADGTIWNAAQLKAKAETFGTGNTYISGTNVGNDSFTYNAGDGAATIYENSGGSSQTNTLTFGAGIVASAVTVSANGNDLVLSLSPTDKVTITNGNVYSGNGWGIQQVRFADGTIWNAEQLKAKVETFGPGNTDISGTNVGNDSFTYNAGDGAATIYENSGGSGRTNILTFGSGISTSSVTVSPSGNDLVLTLSPTDKVTVTNGYTYMNNGWGVQQVRFADGTVWNTIQLQQMAAAYVPPQNKTLTLTASVNVADPGGNYNVVQGNGASDTFVYNQGYGQLTISQRAISSGSNSVLQLGSGITLASLSVSSSGGDSLVLSLGGTNQVTLLHGMSNDDGSGNYGWGVQTVQFADGSALSLAQLKLMAQTAGAGNTALYGSNMGAYDTFNGSDVFTYSAGDGAVTIDDRKSSGTSVLQLGSGITLASLSVSSPGGDNLVLSLGGADQVTILHGLSNDDGSGNYGWGVQTVQFADGTTLSLAQLKLMAQTAGTGNTVLYGSNMGSYDTFNGSDVFTYSAGDGAVTIDDRKSSGTSVLQLGSGITLASLSVSSPGGDNLVLSLGGADQVTILHGLSNDDGSGNYGWGVQTVQFAGGTTLSLAQLKLMAQTAGTGNTVLYGSNMGSYDTFNGSDVFTYSAGDGAVTIDDRKSSGTSVLQLSAGIKLASLSVSSPGGDNLVLSLGGADQITILHGMSNDDGDANYGWGVQTVQFADGTTLSVAQLRVMAQTAGRGTATLYGSNMGAYDTFNGSDVFTYSAGDGAVTIDDRKNSGTSVLQLGTGITLASLSVSSPGGDNLVLSLGGTDQVTILHGMSNDDGDANYGWGVQTVQLADGTTLSVAQLKAMAQTAGRGTATLYGSNMGAYDTFNGSDVFTYSAGDGVVTIDDRKNSGTSLLQLGAGITPSSIAVTSPGGDNLVLSLSATDQITILHGMSNDDGDANYGWGVQTVQFADGTTLSVAQLRAMAQTAGPGNTTLYGSNMGAYDTYNGADTFVYNAGAGAVTIDERKTSGTSVLQLGAGITPSSISASSPGGDNLVLSLSATDQITILHGMSNDDGSGNYGWGVQTVQFADGTTLSLAQLRAMAQTAGPGNTTLYGSNMGAYDTYNGADTFVYNAGDGAVAIDERKTSGASVLQLGSGITQSSLKVTAIGGDSLVLSLSATDQITILHGFSGHDANGNYGWGVQTVQFADGSTLSLAQLQAKATAASASAPSGTLSAPAAGSEVFDSAGAYATVQGNGGSDTFVYDQGYGALTIRQQASSSNSISVLQLGSGFTQASLAVSSSGNDLILSLSNTDRITITNGYSTASPGWGIETVRFADGSTLSAAQLQQMARTAQAGNTALSGTSTGNDTFTYNSGDGAVTINESSGSSGQTNLLELGVGILPDNVVVTSSGNDLVLTFNKTDKVTITNGYYNAAQGWGIQKVQFANGGVVWTVSQMQAMARGANAQGAATAASADSIPGALTTSYVYSTAIPTQLLFVISPEGDVTQYVYNGKGQRTAIIAYTGTPYDPAVGTIQAWAAGQANKPAERTDYTYDYRGQLASTTTYSTVDANGSAATNPSTTTYIYNYRGELLHTVGPDGKVTTNYIYDELGRTILTTTLDSGSGSLPSITTTTHYDDANRQTTVTLANGLVTMSQYNTAGQLISTTQSSGSSTLGVTSYTYDADGRLVMTTDPNGAESWMLYDDLGRKIADIDADGDLTQYFYNNDNQVSETIAYATPVDLDLLKSATTFGAATLASIVPASTAQAEQSWNFYDASGRLAWQVDGLGHVTETQYDGASRVTAVTQFATAIDTNALKLDHGVGVTLAAGGSGTTTPAGAILVTASPTLDRTVTQIYDKDGLLTGTIDAAGHIVQYIYDDAGQPIEAIQFANLTPDFGSTSFALALSEARQTGNVAYLLPAHSTDDIKTYTFYDDSGRVVGQIDGDGYLTETTYKPDGQVFQTIRYAAPVTAAITAQSTLASVRPTGGSETTTNAYDDLGRLTTQTDPAGITTQFKYDVLGELIEVDRGSSTVRTVYDALGQAIYILTSTGDGSEDTVVAQAYDADGNLISRTAYATPISSETPATAGAVAAIVAPTDFITIGGETIATGGIGDPAIDQTTRYVYDAAGRQVYQIDPTGVVTGSNYDGAGRLIGTTVFANPIALGTLGGDPTGLDILDRLVAAGDGSARNWTSVILYDADGNETYSIDGLGTVTGRTYDAFGNVTAVTRYATPLAGNGSESLSQQETAYFFDPQPSVFTGLGVTSGADQTTRYVYDADGRQIYAVDPMGVVTGSTYDAEGRLIATTVFVQPISLAGLSDSPSSSDIFSRLTAAGDGAAPNWTALAIYDADGNETYSIDALGNVTGRTYDAFGNVTGVTRYATSLAAVAANTSESLGQRELAYLIGLNPALLITLVAPSPGDQIARTVYDSDNRAIYTLASTGADDSRESVVALSYDALGNVLSSTAYAGTIAALPAGTPLTGAAVASALAARTASTASLDQTTRTIYDDAGQAIYILSSEGNGSLYSVVAQRFDAFGNVTSSVAYATPIAASALAGHTPPVAGDVGAAILALAPNAANQRTTNLYDQDDRLIWTEDGLGDVTQQVYNSAGQVVKIVQYANRAAPGVAPDQVQPNDADDRVTAMAYDCDGRLVYTVDALGDVVQTVYDVFGNAVQQIAFATPIAAPSRAAAAPDQATLDAYAASHRADAGTRVSDAVYDADGRQIYAVDAAGDVTHTAYDSAGRVVAITEFATPLALPPTHGPLDAADMPAASLFSDRTSLFGYDADGNQVYAVDADGFVTQQQFDAFGNVTATTRYAQSIEPAAVERSLFQAAYAAHPNAATIAAALVASPGLDETTTASYDTAGRLLSDTDAMGNTERYSYDGLGNKLSFTNRAGQIWTYSYDAAGNLASETDPAVEVGTAVAAGGDLTTTSESLVALVTNYSYDALGNLIARTEAANTAQARTTAYGYDALGRQVETIYPPSAVFDPSDPANLTAGSRTELAASLVNGVTYDAFGDAIGDIQASYDPATTATTGSTALNVTLKAYDKLGRVTADIDAEGGVTRYSYDSFGDQVSLTRLAATIDVGPVEAAYLAGGDPAALDATIAAASGSGDRTILTVYDALGRAVLVEQPSSWVDDGAGAGYTAAEYVATHYNAFGEVAQIWVLAAAPDGVFGPDGTSWNVADSWAVTTRYYDQRGNLVATVDPLANVTTQSFDGFGNLSSQTQYATSLSGWVAGDAPSSLGETPPPAASDRTTTYAYDSDNREILQTQVNATYSTGTTGATVTGNLQTWYGYDALGNQVTVTDALGNTTTTQYDALGRIGAVISPAITDTGTGAAAIPVTNFIRDAFGNVVEEAAGSIEGGYTRFTYTAYDARGNAVETTSQISAGTYVTKNMSYDVLGNLVKSWQQVGSQVAYSDYAYDLLNRQVAAVTPAPNGDTSSSVVAATQYDSFGEVTATWTEDQPSGFTAASLQSLAPPTDGSMTYYDYDSAGRVWRTNAKTGVDTVMLYDLQGNQTVTITSAGALGQANAGVAIGPSTAWTPQTIDQQSADPANGLARSDTQFDLLGRAIRQFLAARPNAYGDLYRPEIDQVFDRWGNIVEQTAPYDPHATGGLNGQVVATYFVYNDQNKVIEQIQPNAAGVTALPADAAPVLTDTLWGTGGADVIDSRGQAHLIIGNGGGDTIVYNAGYGALTIDEVPDNSGGATLALGAGIDPSQVAVSVSGNDLVLTLSPTDVITLVDADRDAVGQWGVQSVTFADAPGTTWTAAELLAKATDAAPTMSGTVVDGTLTYQYAAGEGARVIDSVGYATLDLSGVSPGQVGLSTDGAELVLRLSPTDVITITEGYVGSESMSYAQFGVGLVNFNGGAGVAGGTSWTLQQMRAMLQTASPANRTLYGTPQGGDVFTYNSGAGAVTIQNSNTDGQTGVLRLGAGITPSSVVVSASPDGQDLVLKLSATDSVTIAFGYSGHDSVWYAGYGVAQVQFADGATWSLAQLKALAQQAAPGNTALFGADANTRYSYAAGDGAVSIGDLTGSSTLSFASGIEPGQVSVSSPNGVDLVLALSATDIITIPYGYSGNDSVYAAGFGVANVTFADIPGTSWSLATLRAMAAANPTSFGAHATLGGAPAPGPQTYSYAAGTGAVTLTDTTGQGLLQLGAGINPWDLGVSSNRTDLIVRLSATDSVTIANGMLGQGIRTLRFADGYTLTQAQLQSMALTATAANTTLNGPPTGGASFVYNQGAGAATINLVWTNWSAATLQLNGILPAGAAISSPNGQDLVLSFSATDSITIPSGYSELAQGRGIETITFADGTVWNAAHIEALLTGAVLATPGPAGAAAAAAAAAAAGADLSPVTRIAYDADGNEIAMTDADGNTTGQIWNADGELAEVTHADGGKITDDYDAFGDQVATTDAMGNTTQYAYDGLGRETVMVQAGVSVFTSNLSDEVNALTAGDPSQLFNIVTLTTYDALGDRVAQTVGAADIAADGGAAQFTASDYIGAVTLTQDAYDLRGNLIQADAAVSSTVVDGAVTPYQTPPATAYTYDDQGKEITEANADVAAGGKILYWSYNSFGQLQSQSDLVGDTDTYVYDNAGRLRTLSNSAFSTSSPEQTYAYDSAGQLLQQIDYGAGQLAGGQTTIYRYDAAGHQVLEETEQGDAADSDFNVIQYQSLSYDTLGRLAEARTPILDEVFTYDGVGNQMSEAVSQIDQATGVETTIQDLYFAYDAMNRQILADGSAAYDLADPTQSIQTSGHLLAYDKNGNRISDETMGTEVAPSTALASPPPPGGVMRPNPDGSDVRIDAGGPSGTNTAGASETGAYWTEAGLVTEYYGYDAMNRLSDVSTDEYTGSGPGGLTADGSYVDLESRFYNAQGQVVEDGPAGGVTDYDKYITAISGNNINFPGATQTVTYYDPLGRVGKQWETAFVQGGSASQRTVIDYTVGGSVDAVGYDAAGNAISYVERFQTQQSNGDFVTNAETDFTITLQTDADAAQKVAGDSYQQVLVSGTAVNLNGGTPNTATTADTYDSEGNLVYVQDQNIDADGTPTITETRKLINDDQGHVLSKLETPYTRGSPGAAEETAELVVNGNVTGTFGWDGNGKISGSFDLAFAAVSASYPAPASGEYQVQAGDSLQSIALAAYGDASLWYVIAQANGLASDDDLRVGQTLAIPTVVAGIHNNTGTIAPYNPIKIVGSTNPTVAIPVAPAASQSGNASGCGGLGEVIIEVMAAVTMALNYNVGVLSWNPKTATPGDAFGPILAAGPGLPGVAAAEVINVAAGDQNGFQAKPLEAQVIQDGANAAIAASIWFPPASVELAVLEAAAESAAEQGLSIAVGLQKSFSWTQVAASAIAAGVGYEAGANYGDLGIPSTGWAFADNLIEGTVNGFAGGVAGAAATGGKIGYGRIAEDAFGNALGSGLAENGWNGGGQQGDPTNGTGQEKTQGNPDALPTGPGGGGEGQFAAPQGPTPEKPDAISIAALDNEMRSQAAAPGSGSGSGAFVSGGFPTGNSPDPFAASNQQSTAWLNGYENDLEGLKLNAGGLLQQNTMPALVGFVGSGEVVGGDNQPPGGIAGAPSGAAVAQSADDSNVTYGMSADGSTTTVTVTAQAPDSSALPGALALINGAALAASGLRPSPPTGNGAYGTKYGPSLPGWHDYTVTHVVFPASLQYTAAQALDAFDKFGVPGNPDVPIQNGRNYFVSDPFTAAPAGSVTSYVSEDGYTLTNVTDPAHILYDGEIVRTLIQNEDGSWSVTTHGFGNNVIPGFNDLNQNVGPVVFSQLDEELTVYATTGKLPVVTSQGVMYVDPNGPSILPFRSPI